MFEVAAIKDATLVDAAIALAGALVLVVICNAFKMWGKQNVIVERVDTHEKRIDALEERVEQSMEEHRGMFDEILRRLAK